jgi:hypothetical protein
LILPPGPASRSTFAATALDALGGLVLIGGFGGGCANFLIGRNDGVLVILIAPYAAGRGCKIAATFGGPPVRLSLNWSRPWAADQGEHGSLDFTAELKNWRTILAA